MWSASYKITGSTLNVFHTCQVFMYKMLGLQVDILVK